MRYLNIRMTTGRIVLVRDLWMEVERAMYIGDNRNFKNLTKSRVTNRDLTKLESASFVPAVT